MRKGLLLRLSALGAIAVLGLSACGESAVGDKDGKGETPDELVISGVPAEEGTDLSNTYEPVVKMLEKELDMKVKFKPSTSYAAVIEGQRNGKIHIAQYGALAYYQALQNGSDIDVLGAMVKAKGAEPGYQAYGIVPKGSKIKDIKDFAGKKLCFVDESSTSGYLYPVAGLMKAGVKKDDWEPVMAGGHDASAIAVSKKECEAGFALDSMVDETLIEKGDIKKGDLKVVWKSDTIAEPPITVYNGLEKGLKDKIKKVFETKANQDYLVKEGFCEKGKCDLTDQRIFGWEPVEESYYDSLTEVCEETKIDACEKIE
ncbi:phosphate/phosphite/phosphonate ABC transporter substrate-binding protein [Stackebrandtia nassauensis]|uniref:Phosphonate ABC transporter, periplasmic phosphonate-binding protein n=1 Tax=Stackebrandtia nassauensis (strain DSM 44728 / CIP 108903 / NRRL B-16338 / NBRC 102104 / LLR-40K-21) TaxID=446470 RepID=D3Q9Q4_STANL|nr:phosphate/phosphite/phosphonate ABC transporter substrate-binding protein [Stackebrandtia nassauensis]ADD44600.1 phosphonate ABC transporter, periplasmic phosphonate-binding protein [Stackebrandtia nassauensis DSM 44728]